MKRIDTNNRQKDELLAMLKDLKEKLVRLKFDLAEKKLKDVSQPGKIRRDIARVMTALSNL